MMMQTRCPACGWENEAGARICGGCGRPLSGPSGSPGYSARAYGASAGPDASDPDTPTVRDVPPVPRGYAPGYQPGYPSGVRRSGPGTAPAWSAASQRRHASPAGRIALGALIVVALLALVGVGVWAAILRPPLHQKADSALRAQLSSMIATFNHLPAVPTTSLTVNADEASAGLQAGISSNVPVQNVQVSFQGGRTTVAYTAFGFSGAVSTSLVAANGRLTAQDTTVDGPMGLVESGSELQAALNDALANMRHDVSVQQVSEQNGVLTVSVKGNA